MQDLNHYLNLLNGLFELEKKVSRMQEPQGMNRPIARMLEAVEGLGFMIHNPMGEAYRLTRTDVEVSFVGDSMENLVILDVIKPIIYIKQGDATLLCQKGVVLVGGQ